MTARDGVATDLAPLRFTDRVAMKSSALPAVELIPEWEFSEIPANALLWLRDLTTGKEERIFTYTDGKICFW